MPAAVRCRAGSVAVRPACPELSSTDVDITRLRHQKAASKLNLSNFRRLAMIIRDRPSGIRLFFIIRGSVLPRILGVLAVNILLALLVTALHVYSFPFQITL